MEIALWIMGIVIVILIIRDIILSVNVEILEDEQNLHDEIIEYLGTKLEVIDLEIKLLKIDYVLSKSDFNLFLDSIGYKYVPASTTPAKFIKVKK